MGTKVPEGTEHQGKELEVTVVVTQFKENVKLREEKEDRVERLGPSFPRDENS